MESIIKQHNAKKLNSGSKDNERSCNCRNKQDCPLGGKCLSTCIIYKAEVATDNIVSTYYGASKGKFKSRYSNHTKSFRLRRYQHDTKLSKYIWGLKNSNIITP